MRVGIRDRRAAASGGCFKLSRRGRFLVCYDLRGEQTTTTKETDAAPESRSIRTSEEKAAIVVGEHSSGRSSGKYCSSEDRRGEYLTVCYRRRDRVDTTACVAR